MKLRKLPTLAFFLILSTILTTTAAGQQKRPTQDKTPAKTPAAPAPAPPTFETLLPADSYRIYGEVRGVGQLVRSSTVNEMLEPFLKLAGPPKEFRSLVKWLNAHADDVMTSRLLVAGWPSLKDVPSVVMAMESASPEEAVKLERQLNEFLPSVLPPLPAAEQPEGAQKPKQPEPPKPNFYVQRTGSLVLITPTPLQLKKLKPAGSKPLFQDPNFRVARNRFASEPIFVFFDVGGMERERAEQMKQYEIENKKAVAEQQAREEAEKKAAAENPEAKDPNAELTDEQKAAVEAEKAIVLSQGTVTGELKAPPAPDPISSALTTLASAFFQAESHWPDGIGVALSLDGESFDLKALMVNLPGEKSDVIPFTPRLVPGPAIVPESPNILPADTELVVTMSLDFPQIYADMSNPAPTFFARIAGTDTSSMPPAEADAPFAALEKQLKIKVKDDLLPLLGSEIVLSLPINNADILGFARPPSGRIEVKENAEKPVQKGPVVAIALRDKEGMRRLLPKLLEGLGLKGVTSLAQTERREDTELVSFANMFAYAFVGNFLVLSSEPGSVRYVVDSYLKHETLSGNTHFKNYTRWQPRQLQGQIYISPALMESYTKLTESGLLSEQTRTFLSSLTGLAQPVTYSLSNEGLGALHELHLPKNLVLMAVAGIAGESNPPPMVQNERRAMGGLWMLANAEQRYKQEKGGGFVSIEQLLAEKMVSKEMIENFGYKFEVTLSGEGFAITAVPLEYGKSGKLSYFIDDTNIIRAADHSGGPATVSDPPLGG